MGGFSAVILTIFTKFLTTTYRGWDRGAPPGRAIRVVTTERYLIAPAVSPET